MDAGNWIAIAGMALVLLNTWFKDWLERRKAKRELEKPPRQVGRILSWFDRPIITYLILLGSLTLSVGFLAEELFKPDPVTRKAVFNISLHTALIFFYMLLAFVLHSSDGVYKTLRKIIDLSVRQEDSIGEIHEVMKQFTDLSYKQSDAIGGLLTIVHSSYVKNKEDVRNEDSFFYG
jgi:hypothetical protein